MGIQHAAKVFEADGFNSAAQRLVLLELAYRADRKGVVRYSQSEIAAISTLARPTVARWFRHFEEVGILLRLGHGRYRLSLDVFDGTGDIERLMTPLKDMPGAPGAAAELERLRAIRKPDEAIYYGKDGMPYLGPFTS